MLYAEHERGIKYFYQEHISIQDLKSHGDSLQPFPISLLDLQKEYVCIKNGSVKVEDISRQFIYFALQEKVVIGDFYDPIVDCMDLVFSKLPNVANFTFTSICSYGYRLNMEFLLHRLCSFHIFIQEGMSINKFLEWLLWKSTYT